VTEENKIYKINIISYFKGG